jgi:hypothetical protein
MIEKRYWTAFLTDVTLSLFDGSYHLYLSHVGESASYKWRKEGPENTWIQDTERCCDAGLATGVVFA